MTVQYFHITFEIWGGIIGFLAALCIFMTRQFSRKTANALIMLQLCAVAALAAHSFSWLFSGSASALAYYGVRAATFSYYLLMLLYLAAAARFVACMLQSRGCRVHKPLVYSVYALSGAGCAMLALSRIFRIFYTFGVYNQYYRADYYYVLPLIGLLGALLIFAQLLTGFKNLKGLERISALMIFILPFAAVALQYFYYEISFINIAALIINIMLFISYEIEFSLSVAERERRAAEDKIRVFHSQIQPHFIYNALNTIMYLCDNNEQAAGAIAELAGFLQGSVEMIDQTKCVTADFELNTVRHYLNIEKLRFEDNLTVNYDIRDSGFMIPAFTIQTLVENAVRHGIRKNPGGKGVLTVRAEAVKGFHRIEIIDDGAGFDPSSIDTLDETHVGIRNTRERLALMCGGTLDIKSEPGKGTTATVLIPCG